MRRSPLAGLVSVLHQCHVERENQRSQLSPYGRPAFGRGHSQDLLQPVRSFDFSQVEIGFLVHPNAPV